jgi:hypothetical protein
MATRKPRGKTFRTDLMLDEYGHPTYRLPPYMCDRNTREVAWVNTKRYDRERNVLGDMNMTKL